MREMGSSLLIVDDVAMLKSNGDCARKLAGSELACTDVHVCSDVSSDKVTDVWLVQDFQHQNLTSALQHFLRLVERGILQKKGSWLIWHL